MRPEIEKLHKHDHVESRTIINLAAAFMQESAFKTQIMENADADCSQTSSRVIL